jgi:polyisoprenyl-teichoic acid--peptidoglycan teichoic acid transferase
LEHKTDSQPNPAQTSNQATESRVTVLVSPSPPKSTTPGFTSGTTANANQASQPANPPLGRWLLRGLAFGGTAVLSATVGAMLALTTPLPAAVAPQASRPISFNEVWQKGLLGYGVSRPINVLVMGIDLPLDLPTNAVSNDVFSGRSDTLLLLHIDPEKNTVNVLSIPRDTQVEIAGEGVEKINYANVVGGAKMAAQVVSQNLNGVTIDRYVRVSTGAFREMVDLLGGVEVFVPHDMKYVDETQKLYIDLKKGQQTLTGKQAEEFARFRHDDKGDIGRVQRQQQLIRALREKLTNPALVARLPQAIELFQKYIDTNLSPEEMLSLVGFGLGLEQDDFRMVMLPGRFSRSDEFVASYWLMDATAKDQVMSEFFDISSMAAISQQTTFTNTRIAVQNASSDPQMASRAAAYLQTQGFNNVYVVDDWPNQEAKTQIIVQRGDLQGASMLKSTLGFGQVVSASTGDLDSDFTLRVGDDWPQRSKI